MAFRKLQLNLLSESGELINCVSCFAAQVSVFRAPSYAALEVYQRALAGIPGPERISIFLDDRTLIPSEHFFVGFGEHREGAHEPVLNSFLNLGVSPEIINVLSSSFDIEIDQNTPWSALSKCEARRVRLLLATKSRDQVVILNDPFEPLANQWRERFAELIVTFARQQKAIVVVTNLSYRPESWIDNQSIARIQVGEEIQRTIGFGAQGGKGNDLVSQIREIMKDEAKVAELLAEKTEPVAPPAKTQTYTSHPPRMPSATAETVEEREQPALALAVGGLLTRFGMSDSEAVTRLSQVKGVLCNPVYSALLAGTVIIGGGLYLMRPSESPLETAGLIVQEQVIPETVEATGPDQLPGEDSAPSTLNKPASEVGQPVAPGIETAPSIPSALDEYPESVKKSILISFQGLARSAGTVSSRAAQDAPAKSAAPREEAGELLKLLATASDTGEGLPDSAPPSASDPEETTSSYQQGAPPPYTSEEEKREAIRKRFLEAIERAQNMKRQQVADQGGE